jgi:glycosyltransferase involved in cell wall biosynthesis
LSINTFESIGNLFESAESGINRKIEKILIQYEIDILYYIIPTVNTLNFPFIITHWDLGHKSMFAFPEVAMNNSYRFREDYHTSILQKAFAIFVESQTGKNELINFERINPDRIFVVPMFPGDIVKLQLSNDIQEEILKKFSLSKYRYFFYPAQFWSHKNHYNLIEAFRTCVSSDPTFKLVLTGSDKGNLSYITDLIRSKELSNNVIITGFVSNNELYCFYKNAKAMVMPTLLGPTNMPLLEAYEIGCPVLCSNLIGHVELLGNDGIYFDPLNNAEIAEKLKTAMFTNFPKKEGGGRFISDNAVRAINENLSSMIPLRKTFGFNFGQY